MSEVRISLEPFDKIEIVKGFFDEYMLVLFAGDEAAVNIRFRKEAFAKLKAAIYNFRDDV
jgi:hypothetical protein